jgi:hypothetical protein
MSRKINVCAANRAAAPRCLNVLTSLKENDIVYRVKVAQNAIEVWGGGGWGVGGGGSDTKG